MSAAMTLPGVRAVCTTGPKQSLSKRKQIFPIGNTPSLRCVFVENDQFTWKYLRYKADLECVAPYGIGYLTPLLPCFISLEGSALPQNDWIPDVVKRKTSARRWEAHSKAPGLPGLTHFSTATHAKDFFDTLAAGLYAHDQRLKAELVSLNYYQSHRKAMEL